MLPFYTIDGLDGLPCNTRLGVIGNPIAHSKSPQMQQAALDEATALGSKYVFPGVGNEHRPINNIRKPFEWALSYAKLPHMRIHDLRHSFISMGANIGENIAAMKEAAGHSRITTTEGYTHIMDSSTYRAINNVANAICA